MDATPFDREAGYWLQKQGLPERLAAAVAPWLDRGLSALDLGCGGGRIAVALRQRMARVVGVDAAKELVEQAAAAHPEVRFVHGDCLLDATWRALGGPFDLVVSNCSIRRDYTPDLLRLASLCREHLVVGGGITLRIQAEDDLASLLPQPVRKALLFSEQDVANAFSSFAELRIEKEGYRQRFSDAEYLRTFLARIGMPSDRLTVHGTGAVVGVRAYFVVTARVR
jgi:trans-aconitate methyltransferase